MTNRSPARSQPIKVVELLAFRDELSRIVAIIEDAISAGKEKDSLCTFNLPSGLKGVKSLQTFSNSLSKAVLDFRLGKPLQPGQLTERSREHKRNQTPSPQEAVAKAKATRAAKQSTKKKPG